MKLEVVRLNRLDARGEVAVARGVAVSVTAGVLQGLVQGRAERLAGFWGLRARWEPRGVDALQRWRWDATWSS